MATDYSARVLSAYLLTGGGGEWYNPGGVFDAFIGDIYAWRAQANATTWGAGPANYAASKIDENNGAVLVEGNGAVPWAAAAGWGFVAGALQYFDTNLTPTNDQNYSCFIQYANVAVDGWLIGATAPIVLDRRFGLRPNQGGTQVGYVNGNGIAVVPQLLTGNVGIAGAQGYRNGIADGAACAPWNGASTFSLYVGARNFNSVPLTYITADIYAVWICRSNPATVQANALALVTAMSQL